MSPHKQSDEEETLREPADGLIRYSPKVLEDIRKELNLEKKEDRDKAYTIISEWIKQQDHLVKKDYSKDYTERRIATSNGSIEGAKKQIDQMCTFRTLMPQYFQITDVKNSVIMEGLEKADFAFVPELTNKYYRIVIIKLKPKAVLSAKNYTILYKFFTVMGEYFNSYDCCRGYILVCDFFDTSALELVHKINLAELQQFLPILTAGYGLRIKGIYMVTSSKIIETFLNMLRQLFTAKIASRIHAVTSRQALKDAIGDDILPEEYGGPAASVAQMQKNMLVSLSTDEMKEILAEMNQAVTDESKRQIHDFNDQYMGMPGTFRTLSLD